jgi:hypothetical protein
MVLLAHQVLYYPLTEGATQGLIEWARRLAQMPEAAFQPASGLLPGLLGAVADVAGLDVGMTLKIVNMLAAHGILAGLLLVTREDASTRPFWTRLLAPGLLAVAAMPAVVSTNGLESALFALLVFVAFVRFASKEMRFTPEVALWFALATLTRPEGVLYAAAAVLWHLASGELRAVRSWLGLLLYGLVAGAAFGVRLVDPSRLLPSARWSGFASDWDFARLGGVLQDPWSFFSIYLMCLVLPAAVCLAVMWEWSLVRAALLQIVATLLWLAWTEPDSTPELPLLLPALPFCLLLAQEGYSWLCNRMLDVSASGRSRVTTVMVLLPVLLAVSYGAHSHDLWTRLTSVAIEPATAVAAPDEASAPKEGIPLDVPDEASPPDEESAPTPETTAEPPAESP